MLFCASMLSLNLMCTGEEVRNKYNVNLRAKWGAAWAMKVWNIKYTSSAITGLTLTDPSAYRISIVKVAGITEVKYVLN